MTWARFDDLYDDNRKVKKAWRANPRAVGLHAMAITYCARHETDGIVDAEWLEEKLPAVRERDMVLAALVSVGLFEPLDGGAHLVHDYLVYNPEHADLVAKRERDSARKRSAPPRGIHAESNGNPNGIHAPRAGAPARAGVDAPARGPSRPVPSRPVMEN